MKLKLDDKGNAILQDGKPVYIKDDGTEIPFDGAQAFGKISQLNGSEAAMRRRAEEAEAKLKGYEGIEDPEAARHALEKIKNIDDKKLMDSGKVEEVKQAAIKAAEEKHLGAIKAAQKQVEELQAKYQDTQRLLHEEKIGGGFERSKFIKEKIAVPADMVRAAFGQHFKVQDDGSMVALDKEKKPIYSKNRMGEIADLDEALEVLVDSYPYKDQILKSSGNSGSGASASNGTGGKKTYTRAQFAALDPATQSKVGIDASQGKAAIID